MHQNNESVYFSICLCSEWFMSFYVVFILHTEPFSETAAPDALSDSKRSLSGSVDALEESDLFFKIDLDRRCVSSCDDVSESCDWDPLFKDLPAKIANGFSLHLTIYHFNKSSYLPLVIGNRCWLISFVAEARLFVGIKEDLRIFLPGAADGSDWSRSARLSCDCFFNDAVCVNSDTFVLGVVPLLPLFRLPFWNLVFRCLGIVASFKLILLPRSALDDWSNDWNVLKISSIGAPPPKLCTDASPEALFLIFDLKISLLIFSGSPVDVVDNALCRSLSKDVIYRSSISNSANVHDMSANSPVRSPCDKNGCVWQLAYVSELSRLAKSALLLQLVLIKLLL